MTKNIQGRKSLALAIAMLGAGGTAGVLPAAYAEEAAGEVEEVVVTGLRGRPRTATDSPVAIDTFDVETIEQVSFQDTQDVLQTLIPSYNVSRVPIGDGLTFIRPATLRGLPTHHTLVLVNGKRRHRASLVQLGGDGTQGPDVATIPTYAIQSVEVLRDGASSQYGSDAIAGVINFNLKDNREGFSFAYDTGEFYEGDGFQQTLMGNVGLPLGENGFLSISGEYTDSEFTERAEQYCTGGFCITDPNSTSVIDEGIVAGGLTDADIVNSQRFQNALPNASVEGDNVIPWGTPNIESTRLFYNAGYDFDNGVELYSFGNYSQSTGDGSFFYRFPSNSVLSDRRLEDGSRWNPAFNDDGPGPSFPAGFTPRFEGEITDYSVLGGVRGGDEYGFTWDFSARYGYNEIAYTLFNTYNPSLGPTSPTSFEPGTLSNQEIQIQLDMAQELDFGLTTPAVFAFGLSYLDEEYEVEQTDDVASYEVGPWAVDDPFGFCADGAATDAGAAVIAAGSDLDCANTSDPVYRAFPVGSNGFPGYSPAFSGDYARESYAAYADLSFDLTPKLFLQTAVRFEDYTDFGTQTVAKIAGRYRINDQFAVRSSVGTGFRAPTPGQQGTINVATVLPFGVPIAAGTFPPGGPVAQALGANELEPETAVNYTLGFTADFDNGLTVTADLYRIEIDDRTRFISDLDVSTDPDDGAAFENFLALQSAGVEGANTIGQVSWLTNAFDTVTTGFDLVANYPLDWGDAGTTNLSAAINWNDFKAEGSNVNEFLDTEDLFDFENGLPNWRGVYTAVHTINQFTIMLRGSYFGEYENSQEEFNGGPIAGVQTFDGVWFFDLEGSWQVNQNVRVTLGGRNIFDEFPDELNEVGRSDQCCGRIYDSGSVVPWQGGYYYGRIAAEF